MTPTIRIEIAFHADPNVRPTGQNDAPWWTLGDPERGQLDGDNVLAPNDVWVDVTQWTRDGASVARGREREIDSYQAGHARFVLDNRDRRFDPTNPDSPFAGGIEPMRPVRLTATVAGRTRRLFVGYITDWEMRYAPAGEATVEVTCTDAFTVLAANDLDEVAAEGAGETAGARVLRVLDSDQVRFGSQRQVDGGRSTVAATTFGVNALQHLQAVERSEAGFLFVDRQGTLNFRDRHSTVSTDVAATFVGSNVAGVDGIAYHDISQPTSTDLLFNRVVTAGDSGAEFVVSDEASRDRYLTRTLSRKNLLLDDDGDVEGMADFLLGRFATPEVRFDGLTVRLHDRARLSDDDRLTVLGLDVTDRIDVQRRPPGGGGGGVTTVLTTEDGDYLAADDGTLIATDDTGVIVRNVIVDGVEHRISATSWTTVLYLAAADTLPYLRLDDGQYGELGVNRVAF